MNWRKDWRRGVCTLLIVTAEAHRVYDATHPRTRKLGPGTAGQGAQQGAPLTTPPLIYLKLHKTGSETMEAYFEKLAKLDWRHRTERYAWPTKAPETIYSLRSDANLKFENSSAKPGARLWTCSQGHTTLRIMKWGGLQGLFDCVVPRPPRVLVAASFRDPTSRWLSSFFYFMKLPSDKLAETFDPIFAGTRTLTIELLQTLSRPGQQKGATFSTLKALISVRFHSFQLIFGRGIISLQGLEHLDACSEKK